MKTLDFNKIYFTKDQIDILSSYKTQIDDAIRVASLDFFNLSLELLDKQTDKIKKLYAQILENPIDFSVKETINLDMEKRDYCENEAQLEDYWRKYIKYQVLSEIISIENEQKKADSLATDSVRTPKDFATIEKEAREKILKRYDTRFKRMSKITRSDRFADFVNAIAGAFDPHTNYFPPTEKEDFDISMSGKLEGIGATLSEKDTSLANASVITASSTITTGILMIEIIPDKQWKIIVNTIHFDPNRATFNQISSEQQKENTDTLDSIVRQIKQHGSVTILVEGYANNVTNTVKEDREELIPLSNLRAKTILEMLVERGLDRELLSANGKGGANPLAAWKDRENWWKNRRVEFIVTKGDNE